MRIVLASADGTMDLWKLAGMVDKVMGVAKPSVSAIFETPADVHGVQNSMKKSHTLLT